MKKILIKFVKVTKSFSFLYLFISFWPCVNSLYFGDIKCVVLSYFINNNYQNYKKLKYKNTINLNL